MGLVGHLAERATALVLLAIVTAACGATTGSSDPGGASTTTDASTTTFASSPTTGTEEPGSSGESASTTTTTLPPLDPVTFESLSGIDTISDYAGFLASGLDRWRRDVDGIQDIRLTSTADGSEQPVLWLEPDGEEDRPLLVILHSWSSGYTQHAGIPYAMWAEENGWAAIAPEFRGVNDDPDALGSDLAVQDVVDAIAYATAQDGVEPNRVFAVGYSGGGMMALVLAGRHPDEVTAVAAWGPPYDLLQFYRRSVQAGRGYAPEIRAACGGDPVQDEGAREDCLRRSPSTHLDAARDQDVPVFIGQGISDSLVSPSQGARAFNQLADPGERLPESDVVELGRGVVPGDPGEAISTETYFSEGEPEPVFARRSGDVVLVLFDSGHDMVYEASVRWFASDPG